MRFEYPISLSYHEITLTKVGVRAIPAPASKMEDRVSPMKSVDTTISSVYLIRPKEERGDQYIPLKRGVSWPIFAK